MEMVQVGDGLGMKPWDPTIHPQGYRLPGWYRVFLTDETTRLLWWTGEKDGWLTDPGDNGKWFTVPVGSTFEHMPA